MGQLTASISHELMQPIGAGVMNAQAALRFLNSQPPDLAEAREALVCAVNDGTRATEIMTRIRALFNKRPLHKDALDINEVIREIITLAHGEALKNGVSLQTQLAEGLPPVQADRVQLQQVILNLIINAVEAMKDIGEGSRELFISSGKDPSGGVRVVVQDSGPGLPAEGLDRLFDAFYTTKTGGMGMGLSICRSIVEQHGGRIWPSRKSGPGATIQFTLPVEGAGLQVAYGIY
jgi:signal transduction histidine kinase